MSVQLRKCLLVTCPKTLDKLGFAQRSGFCTRSRPVGAKYERLCYSLTLRHTGFKRHWSRTIDGGFLKLLTLAIAKLFLKLRAILGALCYFLSIDKFPSPMEAATQPKISLSERIVPGASFVIASIAGLVGGVMAYLVHHEVSTMEEPSYYILQTGIALLDLVEIPLLAIAALIALVAAIVSLVQNIRSKENASPPGAMIFALDLLTIAPIALLLFALDMPYDAFGRAPGPGRAGAAAGWVVPVLGSSLALAVVAVICIGGFVASTIRVRPARRFGPSILMFTYSMILLVLSVIFAMQWHEMTRPSVVY